MNFHHSPEVPFWAGLLGELCGTMRGALGTHPVRGKGRSPPVCNSILRTFVQFDVRTTGDVMKGGRYADPFRGRSASTPRSSQSPTFARSSQGFAQERRSEEHTS